MIKSRGFLRGRYPLESFEIAGNGRVFINGTQFECFDPKTPLDIEKKLFSGAQICVRYKFPEDITSLSPAKAITLNIHLDSNNWLHIIKV